MTNQSDEQKLIADLLAGDDDQLRATTLKCGLAAMQRKRIRRRAFRTGSVVAAILLLLVLIQVRRSEHPQLARSNTPKPALQTPPSEQNVIPGTNVRVLTDQQLLDLFAGHPVALAGPPGKQKLIIFDAL